jgi:hypothetical protein
MAGAACEMSPLQSSGAAPVRGQEQSLGIEAVPPSLEPARGGRWSSRSTRPAAGGSVGLDIVGAPALLARAVVGRAAEPLPARTTRLSLVYGMA